MGCFFTLYMFTYAQNRIYFLKKSCYFLINDRVNYSNFLPVYYHTNYTSFYFLNVTLQIVFIKPLKPGVETMLCFLR